jgi:56kDa selenium binding protein (SBP56)
VSDPHNPRETGSVRLGRIVRREPRSAAPELPLAGAPQMVEISRDGRRVYFTNSLYASWDDIFYPDGVGAWMARIDADTDSGGMTLDPRSSPTATTFAGCACIKRPYRPATHRATRTASWTSRRTAESPTGHRERGTSRAADWSQPLPGGLLLPVV